MTEELPEGAKVTGANVKVSFDIKDLLKDIRDELHQLNIAVSHKADKAEVEKMGARLDAMERLGTPVAQAIDLKASTAIGRLDIIEKDPIWANRQPLATKIEKLEADMNRIKNRVYVFGTVTAILATVAAALSRVVFRW